MVSLAGDVAKGRGEVDPRGGAGGRDEVAPIGLRVAPIGWVAPIGRVAPIGWEAPIGWVAPIGLRVAVAPGTSAATATRPVPR